MGLVESSSLRPVVQYYWNPTGGPNGTGAYERVSGHGGAVLASEPRLTFVKYAGGGYTYLCQAAIGSARSAAVWQIVRKTDATGDMVYGGTGAFDLAATDLATVALHTYTLGA